MVNVKDLKDVPICHLHNMIQDKCAELVNLDDLTSENVLKIVDDILTISFVAEEKGQHMEDRMRIYKEGIKELGFVRVK